MCGISAVFSKELPSSDIHNRCQLSLKCLEKRGPDHQSHKQYKFQDVILGLAHSRLAILDLDPRSNQPYYSHGLHLIFNGEIFNWRSVKSELIKLGYQFHTQSDTEVLALSFREWGIDCVNRFNGFWSFIIYDTFNPSQIFISRDRLGIKPLYYCFENRHFSFSSEIKSLDQLSIQDLSLNQKNFLGEFFFDCKVDESLTIYENINIFPPGTNCILNLSSFTFAFYKYWSPQASSNIHKNQDPIPPNALESYVDQFSDLIEDSVRLRLNADVTVGLSLSGGLDSSVIACAASKVSRNSIRSFTICFEGAKSSRGETEYAEYVANKLGLDLELVNVPIENVANNIFDLGLAIEDLYTSMSQLSNWYIAKAISSTDIKVVLNGQGGDELFMGYSRYLPSYILQSRNHILARLRHACNANSMSVSHMLLSVIYFTSPYFRKIRYILESLKIGCTLCQLIELSQCKVEAIPLDITQLLIGEIATSTLPRLLRYDDKIMGAWGLEGRPAFLDHRLVEFSLSLPNSLYINQGQTKYLERLYLERNCLPVIAHRKTKLGFPALNSEWTDASINTSLFARNYFYSSKYHPLSHPRHLKSARLREKVLILVTTLGQMLGE